MKPLIVKNTQRSAIQIHYDTEDNQFIIMLALDHIVSVLTGA